jgi:hypothetical protein
MPEEQPAGNRSCLEVTVAGFADRDGPPLGIDEADAFSGLDPADPRDR